MHVGIKQYLKLRSGVRFSELQLVKTLPILKEGRYDGGFVYTQQTKRMHPFGHLCERTIGYAREKSDVGIEKAYNHYLKGQDGKRLMQKLMVVYGSRLIIRKMLSLL